MPSNLNKANLSRIRFLDGKRLFLTPLAECDLESTYRWFHDKEFVDLVGSYLQPTSMAKYRDGFDKLLMSCDGKTRVFLSIIHKSSGAFIGNVSLDGIDQYERKAAFGVFIGEKRYRGKGYAIEAARLLFRFGFEDMGLRRIESSTHVLNKGSQALHQKLGFVREGVARQQYFYGGRYVDSIKYGMLRQDYQRSLKIS
ncbi:MAG: GNAT family N-acetyltransferase [Candidatus Edwardsbacteria bacterium]|jgi:RimJ/RimL family protein N-acetyltransferase|nr:GNAT family N-acetyltransferase [Candidatus Edwardsbacteria bacterium]